MSSTGYAIVFFLCAPDGAGCETLSVRALRYATAESCIAAASGAVRLPAQARMDGRIVKAHCRSLDELCPTVSVAGRLDAEPRAWRTTWPGRPFLSPTVRMVRAPGGVEAVLAILCHGEPEADCSGND